MNSPWRVMWEDGYKLVVQAHSEPDAFRKAVNARGALDGTRTISPRLDPEQRRFAARMGGKLITSCVPGGETDAPSELGASPNMRRGDNSRMVRQSGRRIR